MPCHAAHMRLCRGYLPEDQTERGDSAMAADVVDLIMQDHREVERLFDELKDSPEKRPNLLPVLTTLLTAHSRAEEAEVYPVAAAEAGEKEEAPTSPTSAAANSARHSLPAASNTSANSPVT